MSFARALPSLLASIALVAFSTATSAAGPPPVAPLPHSSVPATAVPQGPPPAAVASILGEISPQHLRQLVDRLAAFGTRHTLSDTSSDSRGIGAARRWIRDELSRYAAASGRSGDEAMRVYLAPHHQQPDGRRIRAPVDIVNVVAEIPGASPAARDRYYYLLAHYDSRATDVMDAASDAPGADDDGSGTALLLELARVLSRHRFDATLVLVATAGEEQGLLGAGFAAEAARAAGRDVRAVLSDDIVGDPTGPSGQRRAGQVRVFSQGLPRDPQPAELRRIRSLAAASDSPSRQLARYVAEVATWERTAVQPLLVFRADRFLRGGDHLAFNQRGFPAVRFTEVEETYSRQHQNVRVEDGISYGDLPAFVDPTYLAGVARLNAATLIHLANAPSAPADARIVVAGLSNATTLRWSASPEPDVAGYEVVWRATTSPIWQGVKDVGKSTEATLDLPKDDDFFGVRAYDRDGYRSPVAFPAVARQ